jgi:creatinine amidohydrolase
MHEMTWVEVQQVLKTTDTVIVPLGSLEEHGPHDPVGCCYILANESARLVGVKTGVPVTPTIPFGVSKGFENFPGTVTVRSETLKELVRDVSRNLIRHGFRRIIFFSAHGAGNLSALSEVSEELREETGALFAVLHIWGLINQISPGVTPSPKVRGAHGGEPVASVMLYLAPDLVDMKKAEWKPLKQPLEEMISESYSTHEFKKLKVTIPLYTEEVAENGVMGDPTKASKEWGEKLFNAVTEYLIDFVEHFKKMRIPEARKKGPS